MPTDFHFQENQPRSPVALFALKHNEQFLVADAIGDIGGNGDGLFYKDTRLLSLFQLRLGDAVPSLLSSDVSHDNVLFRANLTNRPLPQLGGSVTPHGVIHVERTRFLWASRLYERLTLKHYGQHRLPAPLQLRFGSDFADIFEVRGDVRKKRGRMLPATIEEDTVILGYDGLDGVRRNCAIAFSQPPERLAEDGADFTLVLGEGQKLSLYMEIGADREGTPGPERFRSAAARAHTAMRRKRRSGAGLRCAPGPFQLWLEKSRADLALLTAQLPSGPYPFAGIPWFSTPFGRDGILTALELLWIDPSLARGVLKFLAQTQAHATNAFDDAAPGKILHETRDGEMATLGEVPFRQYYGAVDTTPLFVMLAGAYARRTADFGFIDELWSALGAAMSWIEGPGDANRDGFLDYSRANENGLVNQGWKDSSDSVFHADGSLASPPIALIEVQGYAFAALRAMAWLCEQRGDKERARKLNVRAEELRHAVESRFWLHELSYYAIALDGSGQACRVRSSNAGHLLYTRLPSPPRAAAVIDQLLSASFDNGWGLRTLAVDAPRFNPMSYHNGSVWPHDTALCAAGMAKYGNRIAAAQLLGELFAAAMHFGNRLPELYCGFGRRTGEPPVGYPVACLPQAWSAGAPFMMLQACLGITIDSVHRVLHIDRPELPGAIDRLALHNLIVGDAAVGIQFERAMDRVTVVPVGPVPSSIEIRVHP